MATKWKHTHQQVSGQGIVVVYQPLAANLQRYCSLVYPRFFQLRILQIVVL
ncbi:MAG: hypothetical protein NZ821_00530 [Gloeomargarita sp. SKYB31]|nr:hypothetical protein [Gloeomargarita sp. SKYG98]MCS7225465.1 hypothetical protein [Gloeomargarita sp. SKYB31]